MREMSLDEHKKTQLKILLDFSNFCDTHNLRYFLAFGSLIGAVRHKGFIPWDDDTDVMMPQEDYDKLIDIFNQQNQNKNLKLIDPKEVGAIHSYVKIIDVTTRKIEQGIKYDKNFCFGVDIDVFPMSGQPNNWKDFKKWTKKLEKLYRKALCKVLSISKRRFLSTAKTIYSKLTSPFSRNTYLKKAEKLHNQYPYGTTEYVGFQGMPGCGTADRYKKEWFDDFVFVEFEGHKFKAPPEYDKVLTAYYGDYMMPPPLEKRVTHHSNRVFYSD